MKNVIEASNTLIEVADFFHSVAHKENLTITEGMPIGELAHNAGIRIPGSLRGTIIQSTGGDVSKARKGHPLLIIEYAGLGEGAVAFKKCITVKSGTGPVTGSIKVCIDCSITKLKCTITIVATGTIEIG